MGLLDTTNPSVGNGGLIRSATIEADFSTGEPTVLVNGEGGFWLGYNAHANVQDYQFFVGNELRSIF